MEDTADYCRQIEAYLCQKNGGHLVRIVGPAVEKVCEWAEQGVPLKVAYRGIDRCIERASVRGGRRRPMRIEFCEADVLDAFDDWRRALGVTATQVSEAPADEDWPAASRKGSLAAHVERSLSRLLAARSGRRDAAFDETIARITRELDEIGAVAKSARGEARARAIARLGELDALLIAGARATLDEAAVMALQKDADADLAGLAARMAPDALARARERAFERAMRDALNLPVLSYEQ